MKKKLATVGALSQKKQFGQHFLRNESVVKTMFKAVHLDHTVSVLEIGPGDGFLTERILEQPISRLWSFEIDRDWVLYLRKKLSDKRFFLFDADFLAVDLEALAKEGMWTVLANLPYYITFPILERFITLKSALNEGVIMIQEEVAQKLVATRGRSYGFISLFFQYHFFFELLSLVPPHFFSPPPKVNSRLLYFKPRFDAPMLADESEFWSFIRLCFKQPRRTLKNNLSTSHYEWQKIDGKVLALRAQQLDFEALLSLWQLLRGTSKP